MVDWSEFELLFAAFPDESQEVEGQRVLDSDECVGDWKEFRNSKFLKSVLESCTIEDLDEFGVQ